MAKTTPLNRILPALTLMPFLGISSVAFAAPTVKTKTVATTKAVATTKPVTKTVATGIHHAATGRDPFNRTQADTTQGFVGLLRNNAALRQRYARHFGVPEGEVVDFISHALVPYTLPEARTMTTFGVTKTGYIYPVTDHLRKGTKVWATREGVPVFKWTCSNPLAYTLPGQKLRKTPVRTAMVPPTDKPIVANPFSIASAETEDDTLSKVVTAGLGEEGKVGDYVSITPEDTSSIAAANVSVPEVILKTAEKTGGAGILLPLTFLSAPVLLPVHSGESSGPSGGGSVIITPPIDVPEASTSGLLLAATAAAPLLFLRRRRR